MYSSSNQVKVSSQWSMHTAKVNSLAWSPDSLHIASGALDTNIIIWDPAKVTSCKQIKCMLLSSKLCVCMSVCGVVCMCVCFQFIVFIIVKYHNLSWTLIYTVIIIISIQLMILNSRHYSTAGKSSSGLLTALLFCKYMVFIESNCSSSISRSP